MNLSFSMHILKKIDATCSDDECIYIAYGWAEVVIYYYNSTKCMWHCLLTTEHAVKYLVLMH